MPEHRPENDADRNQDGISDENTSADAELVAEPGPDTSSLRAEAPGSSSIEIFRDLRAPEPVEADPSPAVRWLAFLATVLGGLLGALVGFGIGDVMAPDSIWDAVGALLGALTGAVGVGVLANLTLRAMNEWTAANHPEAGDDGDEHDERDGGGGRRGQRRRSRRQADRQWSRRPSV